MKQWQRDLSNVARTYGLTSGDTAELERRFQEMEADNARLEGQVAAHDAAHQRAALLLECIAEDFFTDQAAFDAWVERQMQVTLRRPPSV